MTADLACGLFEALEMTADELSGVHAGRRFEVLMRRRARTGRYQRYSFDFRPVVADVLGLD